MDEVTFINSIDCCFPYEDAEQGRVLAEQGIGIGTNAAFSVLHEVVRAPNGVAPDALGRVAAFEALQAGFAHPLAERFLAVAVRLIADEELSVDESIALMREVAQYPWQLNALAIAYMACDDPSGRVDVEYEGIVERWRSDSASTPE